MKKHRSFLKWAGGKYTLINDICRHLPTGNVLIEPFVGAGSVFLNTNYENYILNDINQDLITLFNVVKSRPEQFILDAKRFFTPENNDSLRYYELREAFNQSNDGYFRSLLFLYLNRHGYNGLCRYNKKGIFNVPFGRYIKIYFPEQEIRFFSEKAQKAEFVCQSYEKVMLDAENGQVIYCDPPYVPLSATASFTSYHTDSFDNNKQIHLANIAKQLAQQKNIPVLISNHDTALTRQWYQDAKLHQVRVRRSISSKALGRIQLDELLALFKS